VIVHGGADGIEQSFPGECFELRVKQEVHFALGRPRCLGRGDRL
jgi:hypothetical protein